MDTQNAPYAVKMHQADALELVKSSAILLILDMPPATSFGLNMQMFVVGPNFKGVKMLLPGPHFVYYSARSRHGSDTSPVTGFFINASPSQVIVRKWHAEEECLVKLSDNSEEQGYALAARNMEFDRQLAPYDINHHKTWQQLSNFISPAVVHLIEPVGGDISVMAEAALVQQTPKTAAEKLLFEQISKGKDLQAQKISALSEDKTDQKDNLEHSGMSRSEEGQGQGRKGGRCFYTHFPHLIKRTGMAASDLTALNLDKSQVLELVLQRDYQGQEELLLGELQFCFIAFLMGQSLEAFGQWKRIVSLLLRCEEGPLRTRTNLFIKFVGVVYWQLKQSLQGDMKSRVYSSEAIMMLDDSWLSEDNFFRLLFKDFVDMLRDATPVNGELLQQTKRLKKLLEETMGWIFGLDNLVGEEDDEYAPVVVDCEDMMET